MYVGILYQVAGAGDISRASLSMAKGRVDAMASLPAVPRQRLKRVSARLKGDEYGMPEYSSVRPRDCNQIRMICALCRSIYSQTIVGGRLLLAWR